MFKRYQVLLPDWLEDYIKYLVNEFDLSFSEVIRVELCISILITISKIFPEYKPGITGEEIANLIEQNIKKPLEREETHRIMSKIYFETRKAVEYRLKKSEKKKK